MTNVDPSWEVFDRSSAATVTVARESVSCETWLPIDGYPGYEVSDLGRVRSPGGRIIGKANHARGYVRVNLPGQHIVCVHKLVADAFLGPSYGARVRHLDRDPSNNAVTNLRYGLPA